jgi:hypothetical protein
MPRSGSRNTRLCTRTMTVIAFAAALTGLTASQAAAAPLAWTVTDTPILDQDYWFESGDAQSDDNVWAVGVAYADHPEKPDSSIAMHWDGKAWTPTPVAAGSGLHSVVALPNEAWAVGSDVENHNAGTAHWDGTSWSKVPTPRPDVSIDAQPVLYSVDGNSTDDLWAVGSAYDGNTDISTAFAQHWDGSQWTLNELPIPKGATQTYLNSVTMEPSGQTWATGSANFADGSSQPWMINYDGQQWKDTPVPDLGEGDIGIFDVTADPRIAGGGAWATGLFQAPNGPALPILLHWNGTAWSEIDLPDENAVALGVGYDGQGGLLITGRNSRYQPVLLRYSDGTVTQEPSPANGDIVIWYDTAVAPESNQVWIFGDYKVPTEVSGVAACTCAI